MDYRTLIKKIRLENSFSQQEFADLIHVSRQSVSKWENNKIMSNLDYMNEICNQFNIPVKDFFNSKSKNQL
ncbi:hypothetical protein HMPREF2811_00440 [Globicatella sp. HMSC072A10]|uniref:helix-turn-helix transcriptional regulator n=1 Tax=Globicatella sp. HMSC072A10 TaxID=1739315 RepID=UPI0008AE1B36|nr:helix-turn-helix transcriptional regulator [Globicatella sp. HMSC072A10]OFK59795.1 hypothetical protein HMPREF2811_00440 [Globicatella sp. HMSC072A10]